MKFIILESERLLTEMYIGALNRILKNKDLLMGTDLLDRMKSIPRRQNDQTDWSKLPYSNTKQLIDSIETHGPEGIMRMWAGMGKLSSLGKIAPWTKENRDALNSILNELLRNEELEAKDKKYREEDAKKMFGKGGTSTF